jgi:putative phage-type endonuclease
MKVENHATREAWLQARLKGIGSSEAAAVCGASQFASPYSVWLEKIGDKPPRHEESEMMAAGRRHEPTIAQWFSEQQEEFGVVDPGDFAMHWADVAGCPMFATPDRILTVMGKPYACLELKCAWGSSGKQWETKIPLGYQVQLTHQLICTGLRVGYFAALIDGYKFRWHRLDFNQKFADALVRKLTQFWQKYVITKEPPPVDFSKATTDALASQWIPPKPVMVDLPCEAAEWTERRAAIATETKRLEREDALLANQLRQAIGEAEVGILPDETGWTWKANAKGTRTLKRSKAKYVNS